MNTKFRRGFLAVAVPAAIAIIFSIVGPSGAAAQGFNPTSICADPANAQTGTIPPNDPNGAQYVVCLPSTWTGDIMIFSHGTVRVTSPPGKIETIVDQLLFEGASLPGLVNGLGGVFAVLARADTGFSDFEPAEQELIALVDVAKNAATAKFGNISGFTYMTGASQGGLFATKMVERNPVLFDGALPVCAPLGSIIEQVDYWGHLLVIVDLFFSELNLPVLTLLEPGTVPVINPAVLADWEDKNGVKADGFEQLIRGALLANPEIVTQILNLTAVPTDPSGQVTTADSIIDAMETAIFIFADTIDLIGGNPFRNIDRVYAGSVDDPLLNIWVRRYEGDAAARSEIQTRFDTTAVLNVPVVSLHTESDPIVPVEHELLYFLRTLEQNAGIPFVPIPTDSYGHCAFTAAEALTAFAFLIFRVEGQALANAESVLPDEKSRAQFRALNRRLDLGL